MKNKITILHLAAQGGFTEIASLLLDNGAKVNIKDVHEWTPLRFAAYQGHLDVVKLLVENGFKEIIELLEEAMGIEKE